MIKLSHTLLMTISNDMLVHTPNDYLNLRSWILTVPQTVRVLCFQLNRLTRHDSNVSTYCAQYFGWHTICFVAAFSQVVDRVAKIKFKVVASWQHSKEH